MEDYDRENDYYLTFYLEFDFTEHHHAGAPLNIQQAEPHHAGAPPLQIQVPPAQKSQVEEMAAMRTELQYFREKFHGFEGEIDGIKGNFVEEVVDLGHLSLMPGIQLPENFQTPRFTMYRGEGSPMEHLRMYCYKMAPYAHNEALMGYVFQESLAGPASKWFTTLDMTTIQSWQGLMRAFIRHYSFNEELTHTREELGRMERKASESVREFAMRWRTAAAQVKPPLTEDELVYEFKKTMPQDHRSRLAVIIDYKFPQLVKGEENMKMEDKANKSLEASKGNRNCNFKRKEEAVNTVSIPFIHNASPPRNFHYSPELHSILLHSILLHTMQRHQGTIINNTFHRIINRFHQ